MAKKIDQLAGSFDNENTGGLLTGLLADEENFDRRAMFRLGSWGVASVGAVIIAVLANQSAVKTRRDDVASLDLTRQSMQIQSVAKESQSESRRLASAIDTLNGDRDRLYSRLTSVEQGLESVTGAIAKQTTTAATPPPALSLPASSAPASSAPTSAPVAQSPPHEPAPSVAPVASVTPPTPATEKSRAEAGKSQTMAAVAPTPVPAPAPSSQPATTSAMPVMTSRSLMAPLDPAAPKLIEPKPIEPKSSEPEPPLKPVTATPVPAPSPVPQIAATPVPAPFPIPAPAPGHQAAVAPTADKTKSDASAAPLAVKRTEFGVDVGGANSVGGLRALWRGLLKSRANAPLAELQPLIVVKESSNGLGMQLRLVAGPLSDAATAAKICAVIADNERSCETTVYDGQHLAMKADEAPVTTESISGKPGSEKPGSEKSGAEKPSSERGAQGAGEKPPEKPAVKPGSNRYFHRRGAYVSSRRAVAAAPVVEEPAAAKKPESGGTLSSFFSSRARPQQ